MNSTTKKRVTRLEHWELYFDPAGTTDPAQLPGDWKTKTIPVTVPHVWEQQRPGYDGVGWYRRTLKIEAPVSDEIWRVRFSAAHYRADVFLNGDFLLRHDGGYGPFVVTLTPHLREGENELLVRVVDPPREYAVEGLQSSHPLRQTALPTYKAGWYYSFGGLWQPVHLLRTKAAWLEDAFIQPQLQPRRIRVDYATSGVVTRPSAELRYTVRRKGSPAVLAQGREAAGVAGNFMVDLPNAPLWSCADPALLELEMELFDGARLDCRSWIFGLREFTTDGKRFLLNGEPIHLRGVLHQGGFPRTLVFPQDAEMANKDVRSILDAGCNLVRMGLRPASPAELDLCDELGLLVIEEPPIGWIACDDLIDQRCLQEVEEMIRRDRNRPAVVMWTLLNEFSDTVYFRHRSPARLIASACELALRLDPTRLMTGNSGRGMGEDVKGNGIFGQGRPTLPICDEHIYLRNFPSAEELDRRIISLGRDETGLLFVSEFGTSGFPVMDRVLAEYTRAERDLGLEDYQQMKNYRDEIVRGWEGFGLERYFITLENFYYALAYDQAEMVRLEQRALRLNARVAGYVITQGADASSEFGGIVDLWREPKRVYGIYRDLNRVSVAIVDTPGRWFAAGTLVPLRVVVSHVSKRAHFAGRLELKHSGKVISAWPLQGEVDWNAEFFKGDVQLDQPGEWLVSVELSGAAGELKDEIVLTVLPRPKVEEKILLMDSGVSPHPGPPSELARSLHDLGLETATFHNQDNEPGLPVVVHLRGRDRTLNYFEKQKVLRREVEAGRTAIFIDCDLAYLHYFFEDDTPREIYGNGAFAGNMGFAFAPELFAHLGPERQIGPAYGACYPRIHPEAWTVQKSGAEILALHAMPYQFGRPDKLEWGATLYTKRYGAGQVWVCSFRLFEGMAAKDPVATDLFFRLVAAARAQVKTEKS